MGTVSTLFTLIHRNIIGIYINFYNKRQGISKEQE